MENSYEDGYKDGWSRKPANPCSLSEYLDKKYMHGYNKGVEDREFCDYYSDEALGVDRHGSL